jgi:hypothetical protein
MRQSIGIGGLSIRDKDRLISANLHVSCAKPTSTLTRRRAPPRLPRGDLIFHDTYFGVRDFIGSEGNRSGNELLRRDCVGTDR